MWDHVRPEGDGVGGLLRACRIESSCGGVASWRRRRVVGVRMEWRKAARWGRRRGQGCSRGLARVVAAYWSGVG